MSVLVVTSQAEQDAVNRANGNNVISCIMSHPTLGLVIEDTWGWTEWPRWWQRYHAAGGQHHLGDQWPAEPPPPPHPPAELMRALDDPMPVQEEILSLLSAVTGGGMLAGPLDYTARRATLQTGLEQLRGLAVIARANLAALPAPASRTAAQREQAFLRRYLLALTRVVLIAVLRPTADDLTVVQD